MNTTQFEACNIHGCTIPADQKDPIYSFDGRFHLVNLCYSHSVELFKTGQKIFMLKYKSEKMIKIDQSKPKVDRLRNHFMFNSFK
jgi:hypothetical protein